uniref:ARID domain-containing protein n=1 Tax=Panagrellus redivivus TaxID=6233 RepID=A0A7E4VPA7_PANRE
MPVPPHYQPNGGSNRPSSSGNNNNAAGGPLPYDSVPPSGGPPPPPQGGSQQQQRLPVEKPSFVPQGQPASINDMNPNTPLYQLIETTKNDPEYNRDVTDSECSALLEFSLDAYFHFQAQQTRNGRLIIPDRQNIRHQIDQMYSDIKQEPDTKMQIMQQQQQQQQARLAQQRQAVQMQQMQQQQRAPRPMHPQMQTVGSGGFQYVANPSTSSQYPPNWPPNGQGMSQGNVPVRPMMQQQQMRHPGPYPVHVQQQQQPAGRSPYYAGDQPGPSNGHPQHPPPGYPNQAMMSPAYPGGPPSAGPQSGGFSRQSSFQDPYGRQPASMVPPPQNMVKQEVLSRPGSSGEPGAMKHSPADFNSPTAMTNGTPINTSGDMHGGMFSPKNGIRQQPQIMPPRNSPMMTPPVHMTKNGLMSPQVMGDAQQSPMQANGIEALRQGGPQNVSPLVAATPPNNNESPNCPKLLAALSKSGDGGPSMLPNGSPAGETLLAANPRKRASEDDKQKPKRAKIDGNNMPYQNMLNFLMYTLHNSSLHSNQQRPLLLHICGLLLESVKASKRALEWKENQPRVFTVSKPRVFSDKWKTTLGESESKSITYAKMEAELIKMTSSVSIGGYPVICKVKDSTREFQFFPGFVESERLRLNQSHIGVDNTNRLVEYQGHQQMQMPQQHQMPQQPNHQMMYPGAPNGGVPPPNGAPNNANVRYMSMQPPPQPPPQHFAPAPIKTA